ncbi:MULTISPECIES: ImmA/IrrE family metallo-endopeptidase [unclassified Bradyrhizobium]|uniref:ImmA/IrrE family metallo-endopeptidase n=1 Tax=unclassified Bradyrhizobium TaxID=2631580 RepID=UPI0028E7D4C4|nr:MULTISPECIES: ImmA/IrrE family metallo-endopeptidase [unclassified Bradyrhizobium]
MANKRSADPIKRVQDILTQFSVRVPPVPVDKIAKGLGAQLRFSPLDKELAGMIYVSENMPIIGVNSLQHPNRQRFTIAHEIGHLELHRDLISGKVHVDKGFPVELAGLNRDGNSALGTETIEIEANRFAAELLMPTAFLIQALAGKPFDIDDEGPIDELARKFRVSRQALEYRIRNLTVQQ